MRYLCDEPGGDVVRKVKQLSPDTTEVLRVFDQMKLCPNLFGENSPMSITRLIAEYWKFWLVDDVGLLCFDPWQSGRAHVHITFWDRRLRGRELLCRSVALSLMRVHETELLLTVIPVRARTVLAFAKRVGFTPAEVHHDRQVFYATPRSFTMKFAGI